MRKILLSLHLCVYSLPSQKGVSIFTANSEWQRWLHPPHNVCQWADLKISSTKASKNPQNLRSERKLLPTLKKHKKDFPILLLVDVKIMRPSPHQIRYRKICLFFFSWGVWHARVGFFFFFSLDGVLIYVFAFPSPPRLVFHMLLGWFRWMKCFLC